MDQCGHTHDRCSGNTITDGGTGTVAVAITSGNTTFSSKNTYTGGTTVSGGKLTLGASDALADTGALTVSGGTFDLGTFSETVGALTLSSGTISGTGALTASSLDLRSGTIAVDLDGTVNLVKTTSGTLTLSGTPAYVGSTSIAGGKLLFTNKVVGHGGGSTGLTVAAGATLASTGGETTFLMAPNTDVVIDGTLSPGDTTIHASFDFSLSGTAKLRFNPGSTLALNPGAQDYVSFGLNGDWLAGSGNPTLALYGPIDYAQSFMIFFGATTPDFAFAGITGYDNTNYAADVSYDGGNHYYLSFTSTPEPGTAVSMLLGSAMLAGLGRRRGSAI